MSWTVAAEELCRYGRSIFDRGLTHGATGNLSQRLADGFLMTPTGANLGQLDPGGLARLDSEGRHVAGPPPTKEALLHLAMYRRRAQAGAVVHLHATHSVALSALADLPADDLLPPLTAYYVMRVGRLPLVPYFRPGDPRLADAVAEQAGRHHAMLLANHGPVLAASTLAAAVDATEELEETARLFLMLRGQRLRLLSEAQVADLRATFPPP
ncbi:MAG: aldolase [Alphaproteobacteria bacterium]|nr:aldolase [Alphaproteobacteria bacterium]